MVTVYVLRSEQTGKRYIGCTEDFERRILEHNSGQNKSTRGKGPWRLVYSEVFATRGEALKRERGLKSGQGRAWLDRLEAQLGRASA